MQIESGNMIIVVLFLLFWVMKMKYIFAAEINATVNITMVPPTVFPPPPPSSLSKFGLDSEFNPSMAVIIVVLISAFFFMGFFSIYIRQCAGEAQNAQAMANGGFGVFGFGGGGGGGGGIQSKRRSNGLGLEIIETFPIFTYSIVKDLKIGKEALECAVCLNEFEDDEMLRLLPECDHVFHPECIDLWLASHATCPVCRANLDPYQAEETPAIDVLNVSDDAEQAPEVSININEEHSGRIVSEDINVGDLPVPTRPIGPIRWNFPRSHSTGHSLVASGECCERFTLRLPDDMRKYVFNMKVGLVTAGEGSIRRGYRTGGGGEGSSRGKRYQFWRLNDHQPSPNPRTKSDRWAFFSRTMSIKSSPRKVERDTNSKAFFLSVKSPLDCLSPTIKASNDNDADETSSRVSYV